MPISTFVGDIGRPWKYILKYADGTFPNLLGMGNSNFAIRISAGGSPFNGTGNWTPDPAGNGGVFYQPTSADVATAVSNGQTQITFSPPAGPTTFPIDGLTIAAKL